MPKSDPGSKGSARARGRARGFTLIELMVVLAIIAVAAGVVSLALREPAETRLEQEGERLATLLEAARAESRAMGVPVQWVLVADPKSDNGAPPARFRFVGLPPGPPRASRWVDERVSAQIAGAAGVTLGPEAILPAQRIRLQLDNARLDVASDGLSPFAVVTNPVAAP